MTGSFFVFGRWRSRGYTVAAVRLLRVVFYYMRRAHIAHL